MPIGRTLSAMLLAVPASLAAQHTPADVRFMQRMIAHHAQAVTMAALAPTHSRRSDVKLVAERIDVSQRDEMKLMRRWLASRREAVPSDSGAHDHAAMMHDMPGMLSEAELARLAAARGTAFDRLFVQYMIRHHEGALRMVAELFASRGGGQESEIFRFATDVDADQRAEIARLRALLARLPRR